MELKQKIANLEKQLTDAEKQIGRSCLCTLVKHVEEKVVLSIRLTKLDLLTWIAFDLLGAKRSAVVKASSEGQELTAKCHDILDWLSDTRGRLDQQQPVSGNIDVLKEQAEQQRVSSLVAVKDYWYSCINTIFHGFRCWVNPWNLIHQNQICDNILFY